MLGKTFRQREFFNTENVYTSKLQADSFYRFLADHRQEIFRDDDYASLYCANNGRTSVPPSLLATAGLLQSDDPAVRDDEAVQRATYDIRWAVALGTELATPPFAKSTLQEFRAKLILNDRAARQQLLTALAADARALLEFAQASLANHTDAEQHQKIRADATLLTALLLQDLEIIAAGQVQIKDGVAKDRIVSTSDPEMRHGRKSSNRRFDGHKAALATETDSQLITAVEVIAGNAHDSETVPQGGIDASAANTGNQVATARGDCAFGTAEVREQFETRSTELVAKVPQSPQRPHFTKHDFTIDLKNNVVTCSAGQTTSTAQEITVRFGKNHEKRTTKRFVFAETVCAVCPLRAQCLSSKAGGGKSIQLHPREDLLQQARAAAKTQTFKEHYHRRVAVEHSITRLVQRGIRQSRYNSRKRTL